MVLFLIYHPTGSLEGKKALPKQKAKIDGKLILTTKKKKSLFPHVPPALPILHPKLQSSPAHPRKAAFTSGDPVKSGVLRHSDLGGMS